LKLPDSGYLLVGWCRKIERGSMIKSLIPLNDVPKRECLNNWAELAGPPYYGK